MHSSKFWERIESVMNADSTVDGHHISILSFFKVIGLTSPRILYEIKEGKSTIPIEIAQRIHTIYPNYSIDWLLGGGDCKEDRESSIRGQWVFHKVECVSPETGLWERLFDSDQHFFSLDFIENGKVVRYEVPAKVDTLPFMYDYETGIMMMGEGQYVVLELVDTRMIVIDCSMQKKDYILKFEFERPIDYGD